MQRTVSELLAFQACPAEWAWRYIARRVPPGEGGPTGARTRGIIVHSAFDAAVREGWKEHSAEAWTAWMLERYINTCHNYGWTPDESMMTTLETAAHRMHPWWWASGMHLDWVGSEMVLATPSMRGILDGLAVIGDKYWSIQYKTVGRHSWIPSIERLVRRSMHETLYRRLVEANFPEKPYGGIKLVMIPLDAMHTRQAGSTCPHCDKKGLAWRSLYPTESDISLNTRIAAQRGLDIQRVIVAMEMAEDACHRKGWPQCGGPPPVEQRGDATGRCMSPWGNRPLCVYMDGCDHEPGFDIFDSLLWADRDPNERYNNAEE